MLKRLVPIASAARSIPARLPAALQPLMRMSRRRQLVLGLLLVAAATAIAWWMTGAATAVLAAAGLTLGIILAFVIIEVLARRISQSHARAWELEEAKAASINEQAKSWVEQTKELRRLDVDTSRIPIFLLIGESGAGKTSSLRQAELVHPFGPEPTMGDGGTRHCLMHFTDDAWVIDTAGRYVISGQLDESAPNDRSRKVDEAEWLSFLERLRRFRPRSPINGAIVAIPADALLQDDRDVRRSKAVLLRKAMNELRVRLGVAFPVTVMITKADRIGGFSEYFDHLQDPKSLRQLFGWAPGNDSAGFDVEDYRRGVAEVTARLRRRRLGVIESSDRDGSAERLRRIHSFPEEFASLAEPLECYLQAMLGSDRYFGSLRFRGFFLTSSLQDGAATLRTCEQLLGCSVEVPPLSRRCDRTLFVHDFYAKKVFREAGMVVPTSRSRRVAGTINRTALAAVILLLLGLGAWALHDHRAVRTDLTDIAAVTRTALGIPERSSQVPVSDLPRSIADLERLGEAIQSLESGERLSPGWLAVLGRPSRAALLDQLRQLHVDRVIAVACGVLPAAVRAAIDGGGLRDPSQRTAVMESLLAIAAAHVDGRPPSASAVASMLRMLDNPPSEDAIRILSQEYERCMASSSRDALGHAVRTAIDEREVARLSAVQEWHPIDQDTTWLPEPAGSQLQLGRLTAALGATWHRLIDRGESDPETRLVRSEFLEGIQSLERSLAAGTPMPAQPSSDPLRTERDFLAELRRIVTSGNGGPHREMQRLLDHFTSSLAGLAPDIRSASASEWVDSVGEHPRLSTLAESRRDAALAMQSLQRQYELLIGVVALKARPRPDPNEQPLERILAFLRSGSSSDLDSFHDALKSFRDHLLTLEKQASQVGWKHDAQLIAQQIVDQFVRRVADAANKVLTGPDAEGALAAWADQRPIDRIRGFAIPLAEVVREWRDRGRVERNRADACIRALDHAVVVMVERLVTDASRAIPRTSGDPLDWTTWMPPRNGPSPTRMEVKIFLQETVAHYDELFGTADSSTRGTTLPFAACQAAGLAKSAEAVKDLLRLQGDGRMDAAKSIEELVEFVVTIQGLLSRAPADWIGVWRSNAELLASMRPVPSAASSSAPRSIVEDRLRQLAASIEHDLRTRLGSVVFAGLQDLSSARPRCAMFGGHGPTEETEVHRWFRSVDEFEREFGEHLSAQAGSNGQPLAILDGGAKDWLAEVRSWRRFLYGDGDPRQGFAQRRVEIRLENWPFAEPFLNVGVNGRVLRFNAAQLGLAAEDALQVDKIEAKLTNRSGDGLQGGQTLFEGALAILALDAQFTGRGAEIEIDGRPVRVVISFSAPEGVSAPQSPLGPCPDRLPMMAGGAR